MNNIQILHEKTRCMTMKLMSFLFMKTNDLNPIFSTFKSTNRWMFYRHTLVLQMFIIIADNRSHHDCRLALSCQICPMMEDGVQTRLSFACTRHHQGPLDILTVPQHDVGTKRHIVLKAAVLNSSPRAPPLCTFRMLLLSLQTFVLFERKCPAKWTSHDIPPWFQFEANVFHS